MGRTYRKGTSEESSKRRDRLREGYPKRDPKTGQVYVDKSTATSRQRVQDSNSLEDKAEQLRKLREVY